MRISSSTHFKMGNRMETNIIAADDDGSEYIKVKSNSKFVF